MLVSATLATLGQMFWKLGANAMGEGLFTLACAGNIFVGLVLYASGSITMMIAFRSGEVSVLHPIMSFSYILSQVVGALVFHDEFSTGRTIGIILITIGIVVLMQGAAKKEKKDA